MLPGIEEEAELAAEEGHEGLHRSLSLLQVCFSFVLGDVLECGLYSRLGVQAQLICQVDVLFALFILTESIIALLQYVFVGL